MQEIVMWIVVGLIVGWLAGSAMKGRGYGLGGDLGIGVVGAIAGSWLVTFLIAEADRAGIVGSLIAGAVSALLFIGLARLLTRRPAVKQAEPARTPEA